MVGLPTHIRKKHIVVNSEIVEKLHTKVTAAQDVVFARDYSVNVNVEGEAVASELS